MLSLFAVSIALVGIALPATAAKAKASASVTKVDSDSTKASAQDDDIRQVLMELASAINSGSPEKASSPWSEDAIFIDQFGEQFKGKSLIKARFEQIFKQRTASEITLHPESIKMLGPNVASVVGSVSRKSAASHIPLTRFSLVLLKQNGTWLIDEATETTIQDISAADHLKELELLIGQWQWTNKEPERTITLEIDWSTNKNFLLSKCTKVEKGTTQVDRQVIGWDPRSGQFVSWHFDCNGGFGYGKWSQDSGTWLVDFAGVSAGGKNTRAMNSLKLGATTTELVWQSTQQTVDGVAMPDCGPLTLVKSQKAVTSFEK